MRKVSPWSIYLDVSDATLSVVYMQNYLLRELLAHYGVYFLSRISPSWVRAENSATDPGPKDSLRFPLGTPNAQAMESVFLKGLIELLERIK